MAVFGFCHYCVQRAICTYVYIRTYCSYTCTVCVCVCVCVCVYICLCVCERACVCVLCMHTRKRGHWRDHKITTLITYGVESSWNVMAHGDARERKWGGNWRMEWVANTLHTTSEHGVSSITTADAHTSAASSRLNWHPRRFKWTRPFAERRNLVSARVPSHFKRSLAQNILHIHTFLRTSDQAYVSQWCAAWMVRSSANFPNCSRRCQTLAAARRRAAILVDCCRRKGPQQWTALQHFNQRTHVFATAAYSNHNVGRGSSVSIETR